MKPHALHGSPQQGRRDWYRIDNQAGSSSTEILIYGDIGSWWSGVDAEEFARELTAITSEAITVRIHSRGGRVHDGIAIMNSLRAHKAHVTTIVDGIAASAASVIAMAGDEIVMRANSEMMIHEAWGYAEGDAEDMRGYAEVLDKASQNIATVYARRAGGTADEWRAAMRAETWYSDTEAVSAGLADRIDGVADQDEKNRMDLSIFNHAGRAKAPAPLIPSASAGVVARKEGAMPTLIEGLRKLLGTAENADEATVLAAVEEALNEQAETPTVTVAVKPEDIKNAAERHGLAVVDRAQYEEILAAAGQVREIRAKQQREADENLVQAAIIDGRIAPARREHWLNALDKDREGATAALDSLEKGLIPVAEAGHAKATEPDSGDADAVKNILDKWEIV